jgi:hypothetical protein
MSTACFWQSLMTSSAAGEVADAVIASMSFLPSRATDCSSAGLAAKIPAGEPKRSRSSLRNRGPMPGTEARRM